MTGNQIAAESNRISWAQQEEDHRHNEATEAVQEKMAVLQELRDQETQRHNQSMEQLTKEYNEYSLKLQKAQGDEKNRIAAQMANIEEAKAEWTKTYQQTLANLQHEANVTAQDRVKEDIRHNAEMEKIQSDNLVIMNKKIEYENTNMRESNRLRALDIENAQLKVANDFLNEQTRMTNDYMIAQQQHADRMEALQVERAKLEQQKKALILNIVSDTANAAMQATSKVGAAVVGAAAGM